MREAVRTLGKAQEGLTDDNLVETLHNNGVIPGEDPRRGRNIFEACLYLSLVSRAVNTELKYSLNKTGRQLFSLNGHGKTLSQREVEFFTNRALRFKVPNSSHYQDSLLIREKVRTGFKHYYATKRVRPFASFLILASKHGKSVSREEFISTATTALLSENEEPSSQKLAAAEVAKIAKKHGFDESRSPFRDAQVLTSWADQLGIYERVDDTFKLTTSGKKVVTQAIRHTPIWWLDLAETHHASLILSLIEIEQSGAKLPTVDLLAEALESVLERKPNLQSDLASLERFGIQATGNEITFAKEPLFELEYDIPIQAQRLIDTQTKAILQFISRRNVVPVPTPLQTIPPTPVARIPTGKLSEIPALASRTQEVLRKYGDAVAGVFEDQVFKAFQQLGFEITQLGHVRAGRAVPDSAILDSSTLAERQPAYAVLVDCKSTGGPYSLSKSDSRAISDYIRDSYGKLLNERFVLRFFLIVAPQFTREFTSKLIDVEATRTFGVNVIGLEADALLRLIELHDGAPFVLSKSYLRLDQILDASIRQKTSVVNRTLVETLFSDARKKR